jgi:uncharacterized protein YndB with AHSA1/START domain
MKESEQLISIRVPAHLDASPAEVYRAWTDPAELTHWLVEGGRCVISAVEPDGLYYLSMLYEGRHYPHYGRYLRTEPGRLLEFTWVSEGTRGLESEVAVRLTPERGGTRLELTHSGLQDDKSARSHEGGWAELLELLARRLGARGGQVTPTRSSPAASS